MYDEFMLYYVVLAISIIVMHMHIVLQCLLMLVIIT